MLAIAEVRQRDNQNAHHLVETSSFHEDVTKDDMPLDDGLSLSFFFLQTNTKNSEFSICPDSEVSEENPT